MRRKHAGRIALPCGGGKKCVWNSYTRDTLCTLLQRRSPISVLAYPCSTYKSFSSSIRCTMWHTNCSIYIEIWKQSYTATRAGDTHTQEVPSWQHGVLDTPWRRYVRSSTKYSTRRAPVLSLLFARRFCLAEPPGVTRS